jgi:hypothetical protein
MFSTLKVKLKATLSLCLIKHRSVKHIGIKHRSAVWSFLDVVVVDEQMDRGNGGITRALDRTAVSKEVTDPRKEKTTAKNQIILTNKYSRLNSENP